MPESIPVHFVRETYEAEVAKLPEAKRPTHVVWFGK